MISHDTIKYKDMSVLTKLVIFLELVPHVQMPILFLLVVLWCCHILFGLYMYDTLNK